MKTWIAAGAGMALLIVLILVIASLKKQPGVKGDEEGEMKTEHLTDTTGFTSKRLVYYHFETGDAADSTSHLAASGHRSRQSLRMNSKVSFSPGLYMRFSEMKPAPGSWIRATARIWFPASAGEPDCSLIAACNHNGINYKYMSVILEKETLVPGSWNPVAIDYRLPEPSGDQDVMIVTFWYYGKGEILVDDIEVRLLSPAG
jgi:hypothetical protein